ncbi:hypothetical protein niasHT_004068 [Heterodera trifolii]|uniref:Uncharacterized protein n=1 Tax=Heterodera trifolii TaxID=157864 RepID=A0ABD2MCT1_9BILA
MKSAAPIGGRHQPLFSQLSSSSHSSDSPPSSSPFTGSTILSSRRSSSTSQKGQRTSLVLEPKMSVLVEDELEDFVGAEQKLLGERKFKEWEQRLWQWGQAEEQANRLFKLCDRDRKGFIVRADLDRLNNAFIPSGLSFAQLEHAFELGDRHRVNLVYEKDFLRVIKSILCDHHHFAFASDTDQMETKFKTLSLAHNGGEKKHSNADHWSPTQKKLTIAINDMTGGGGGLATVSRAELDGFSLYSPTSSETHERQYSGIDSQSPSLQEELEIMSNELAARVSLNAIQSPDYTHLPTNGEFNESPVRRSISSRGTTFQQNSQIPDRIFKVVFVGDSAVGKTCFLHRFCHNRFKPLFNATIGVDFTVKTLLVRERMVALQLWDTAGQERFRSITKQYFRKADGVVLMYDVTSESSFLNVRNWIESVKAGVDNESVLCLVGNKVDLYPNEHCRTITYQHGKDLAEEYGMLFFESSAFTGQGIEETMQSLALRLQQREDDQLKELIKLEKRQGKRRNWQGADLSSDLSEMS